MLIIVMLRGPPERKAPVCDLWHSRGRARSLPTLHADGPHRDVGCWLGCEM